jgi:hypothetical protein
VLSSLLVTAEDIQDRVQPLFSPFNATVNAVLNVLEQALDSGGGLNPADTSLVLWKHISWEFILLNSLTTHKQSRTIGWNLGVVDTMRAEIGTKTSVGPGQVLGRLRVGVVIFAAHQIDQFIAFNLSVGAEIAMINEPLTHLRVGPALPGGVLSRHVVVPNKLLELLALDLSVRLDNVALDLTIKLVHAWNKRGSDPHTNQSRSWLSDHVL